MQDKKDFGKYILEKRKERGLTQEQLASRLFVLSTTVSKWERGISYPDITMVTNLCKELNISEHEFFVSCDDASMDEEKSHALNFQKVLKGIRCFFLLSYGITLLVSFICNYVIDEKLSWFYIVANSLAIAFCITNLPFYIKKDSLRIIKIFAVISLLIYSLLFFSNMIVQGNWFFQACILTSFELILVWIGLLICTFMKIDTAYKISLVLILISISGYLTNDVSAYILNYTNQSSNVISELTSILVILVALIIAFINFLRHKKINL